MNKEERVLLFTVTERDCRFDYYVGSGKGGQKRNRTYNCVRVTHIESGAVGKSEEGRSQRKNKEIAFKRMSETQEFKNWHRIETSRRMGHLSEIKKEVERELKNVKVEVKVDGVWKETKESLNE